MNGDTSALGPILTQHPVPLSFPKTISLIKRSYNPPVWDRKPTHRMILQIQLFLVIITQTCELKTNKQKYGCKESYRTQKAISFPDGTEIMLSIFSYMIYFSEISGTNIHWKISNYKTNKETKINVITDCLPKFSRMTKRILFYKMCCQLLWLDLNANVNNTLVPCARTSHRPVLILRSTLHCTWNHMKTEPFITILSNNNWHSWPCPILQSLKKGKCLLTKSHVMNPAKAF